MTGSGNCVIDDDDGQLDVHRHANKLIHRYHAPEMKNRQRKRIQMCSSCMGVA